MGDMGLLAITAYVYQSVRGIVLQFPCPFLYFKPFIRGIDEQQNFLSMKKTYFKFLNALVILCVSLSLASCSDDDDNESGNKSLIVGKWKITSSTEGVDEDEKSWIFSINADGTYSNGDGDETDDRGTWNLDGNTFNYKSSIWGLSFSAEILELNKTTFTAKAKNPIASGYVTTTYKRVE